MVQNAPGLASPLGGAEIISRYDLRMERAIFGLKANGGFFSNRRDFDLPNILGLIILFDGENGRPLTIMDSITITLMRTAATTALAAKYLARADSTSIAICGCGNQGRIHLEAIREVLPNLNRVYAWDHKEENAERFAADMVARSDLEVRATADLGRAASNSDVIVTTTPARSFFLCEDHIRPGTFISAVGADSPDKQELEPSLLAGAKLIVDILEQCAHVGELHHALAKSLMTTDDVHAELGEVVLGAKEGRCNESEIIVFDTTGSAIQDTAAAVAVYEQAVARGLGFEISLYD